MNLSTIVKFLCIYAAFFFIFLSLWLERKFGSVSLSQLLYHATYFSEGLFTADRDYISSFIRSVLLATLYATIIVWFFESLFHAQRRQCIQRATRRFIMNPYSVAKGRLPSLRLPKSRTFRGFPVWLSVLSLAVSFSVFLYDINAVASAKALFKNETDQFASLFVDPAVVPLEQTNLKNLVLIYVESLEDVYAEKDVVGKDLLLPLSKLGERPNAFSFGNFLEMPGTNWTIAGIVGSQCGVPLKILSVFDGNQQGENVESFLPNAVCLGDILSEYSFRNVFMRGASMKFAGTGEFLSAHGYTELYGRERWLDMGYQKQHFNQWGLYDDDLFDEARLKVKELMRGDQPFNLTVLTVDMHPPHGFLSKKCGRMGFQGFEGIVECTAQQISDFVKFVDESGWSDDIRIVVMGDHFAFDGGPLNSKFNIAKTDRGIFNLFISSDDSLSKARDTVTHFDIFPTILEFMGFVVPSGRLGLGYSALATDNSGPPDGYLLELEAALRGPSETYKKLWLPGTVRSSDEL